MLTLNGIVNKQYVIQSPPIAGNVRDYVLFVAESDVVLPGVRTSTPILSAALQEAAAHVGVTVPPNLTSRFINSANRSFHNIAVS